MRRYTCGFLSSLYYAGTRHTTSEIGDALRGAISGRWRVQMGHCLFMSDPGLETSHAAPGLPLLQTACSTVVMEWPDAPDGRRGPSGSSPCRISVCLTVPFETAIFPRPSRAK